MRTGCAVVLVALLLSGCSDAGVASTTTTTAPAPPLAVAAWEGMPVETICLVGSETYERVAKSHTPIMDSLTGVIDDAGLAWRAGPSGCDVTITFGFTGEPLSDLYSGGATGTMFTGADVEGTISISAEGRRAMSTDLASRREPPESFFLNEWQEPPGDPEDAPFWGAVKGEMCDVFAGWFEGTGLTDLLTEVIGHWPPRDDECEDYQAGVSSPFENAGS